MVLMVFSPCVLTCGGAENHGGEHVGSKDAHFMVIRAEVGSKREDGRERENKLNIPLKDTPQ